jgi:hypothetical protein
MLARRAPWARLRGPKDYETYRDGVAHQAQPKCGGVRIRAGPNWQTIGGVSRRLHLLLLVCIGLALAGCSEAKTKTVVVHSVSTTTTSEANPARAAWVPRPADAVTEVETFYREVTRRDFAAAWAMLPASVQAEAGSLGEWKQGYRWSIHTLVNDASLTSITPDKRHVQVAVDLESRDIDACTAKGVDQTFSGTWSFSLAHHEWVADSLSIQKTGGATPHLKFADCRSYRPPSGGGGGYHSSYTPSYTPSNAGEDLGPGNGYTVTCADGSISHSGGIQGACSWHGGVAGGG